MWRSVAGAAFVAMAASGAARAELDDPGFELTDVSAWMLRAGELQLSPAAIRVGLFDAVELGSSYPLDLLGAVNADVAVLLHASPYVAFSARAGFLHFDPAFVGVDSDFELTAFPLALDVSVRPTESIRVHGAIQFLSARPDTQAPDSALRIQRYLGPVGRLALTLSGEYRFGAHFAALVGIDLPLMAHRRTFLYQGEDAGFGAHVRATAALHLVFGALNVRVGLGYGPSFLGEAGIFPVLDLALRIF